jgi:hypothetical protein
LIPWENEPNANRQSSEIMNDSGFNPHSYTTESIPVYTIEARSDEYPPQILVSEDEAVDFNDFFKVN